MSDAISNAISAVRGTPVTVKATATNMVTAANTAVNNAISNAVSTANNAVTSVVGDANAAIANAQATANSLMSSATATVDAAKAKAEEAQAKAQAALDKANALNDRLNSLPLDRDPELIKQQIEAEILKKKAELEQKILYYKETALESLREKLKMLIMFALTFPPKLPLIDPKTLQKRAIMMAHKEAMKLRSKTSIANLSKGKELYKYPLKNVSKLNLPSIPQIPKVPDLPKLPQVPQLPRINV